MKITLVVLFLAGLTIYCKCAAVLSLPPSLIPYAAFLDETLKTEKPLVAKDNELQQQLLTAEDEEESNEPALAADLYTNFKNLWHNDLSLNLQKREQRNVFDDDIDNFAAIQQRQQQLQQAMATIKRNNQNRNGPRLHDDDNVGHKNYNHNNNNKNENGILKSASAPLPLSFSSAAATNMNEATSFNLNMQPQLQLPLEKAHDVANEWLSSSSPAMIDDIFVSPPHQIPEPVRPKRRELENMPLLAVAATATEDSPFSNRFLKSTKYWPRQCTLENENNCQREYYGSLVADRNNALWQQLQDRQNNLFPGAEKYSSLNQNNDINDDDVVLLLTAEQSLIKFLSWALSELYPYGKFPNVTDNAADSYHPGIYMWKKLNLSGQLEPPLLVDEPKYVIVRREYDPYEDDDNDTKRGLNYDQDPFIPPRGRKHNLPDLDSLLQRYETFVPNRGRRDKLKDIFKYDEFFYPNRGKRQMTAAANDKGITHEKSDDTDIQDTKENQSYCNNEENAVRFAMQYPSLLNELMEYRENLMKKMKRKLHQSKQKVANIFEEIMANRNEPTRRMSTPFQQASPAATVATVSASAPTSVSKKSLKLMFNTLHNRKKPHHRHSPNQTNARRQLWNRHAADELPSSQTLSSYDRLVLARRSPTMVTNRLQQATLKSMSPQQQLQLTQSYKHLLADLSPPHLRPVNKFMWQQQQNLLKPLLAQQFDPSYWHKLQLLLKKQQLLKPYQHRHRQPLLTMRHPRLTALQHLPPIPQQQQQLQLATPHETQLTYSPDQLDNSITNDLDNLDNNELD